MPVYRLSWDHVCTSLAAEGLDAVAEQLSPIG